MLNRILQSIIFLCSLQANAQKQKVYTNPILTGFYPDPGICRVGDDYYIVNSSFAYFPGLPLFHSKDLVSWKQIGHAMDRIEQLDLQGAGVSRGLFAPAISYHKDVFYIVCTLVDKGGNFVITAKDPAGPWSNPVWLHEVDGIDPSIFFDDDDKAWIVYNSGPPDNKSLWEGHRTIRMFGFDYKNLKITGEQKLLVNGGVDISKKPIWIEGPHIYKKNGWYYLLCAEGGTGYDHSEVAFRSKTVDGPYIPYDHNPILTQRHLDRKRKDPITTTGHADLVETPDGKWYAVFLGCRPYEDNHFNTGRETFMAPVRWINDWPVITKDDEVVQYHYPLPQPQIHAKPVNAFSGNFVYRNEFNTKQIDQQFVYLRTINKDCYSLTDKKGFFRMNLRPETVSGAGNPSFLGHRQQHLKCEAIVSMEFNSKSSNEKAGLIIFQSEHHFYYLCESIENEKPVVQLYKSTASENMELIASAVIDKQPKDLQLKIEANGSFYSFYFLIDKNNWQPLKDKVDAKFLSTETAGGFVGCVFGMYATSLGRDSGSKAYFDWFEYRGDDEVFKVK
ncbi:MAG: glycoside hydrolase family 43 protein [Flavisolibacter sp.]